MIQIIKEAIQDPETRATIEPAVGRCECGGRVELGAFTCPCPKCDREYNWNGTLLAPREFWGEETGERF